MKIIKYHFATNITSRLNPPPLPLSSPNVILTLSVASWVWILPLKNGKTNITTVMTQMNYNSLRYCHHILHGTRDCLIVIPGYAWQGPETFKLGLILHMLVFLLTLWKMINTWPVLISFIMILKSYLLNKVNILHGHL